MSRPLIATIDIDAMRANLNCVRQLAPNSRVWAVLKADAYGHGLIAGCQGFAAADGFGLIEFDRAVSIRDQEPNRKLLLLEGAFDEGSTRLAVAKKFELVVHHESQLRWIEALDGPRNLSVWLKFNNGMNRLGFGQTAFRLAFERLASSAVISSVGLLTHFANADQSDALDEPIQRFEQAADGLPGPRSMANSAACIAHNNTHAAWVRPGLMLYGASPVAGRSAASIGLKAVMSLESKIIAVQSLLPGDRVGYGGTFTAGRPMRVGLVAGGYGDGYPRAAGTGTPVLVDGHRSRLIGRVSMDMVCVDLEPVPGAAVGARVQLWGDQIGVDEVATSAGTIANELLCCLASRVPVQMRSSSL